MVRYFITGVHGVGKSTFCKKLSERISIPHYSAGELIKGRHNHTSASKQVEDVDKNQNILLSNLRALKKDGIILDGHLVLIDKLNDIASINFNFIQKINPQAIILLVSQISNILINLEKRDRQSYSKELINSMQIMEWQLSEEYARKLSIPFYKVDTDKKEDSLELMTLLQTLNKPSEDEYKASFRIKK